MSQIGKYNKNHGLIRPGPMPPPPVPMQAPNTIEGFLTEAIMSRVREKVPHLPTHVYNPIFSSVLETLEKHMPEIRRGGITRKEFIMRGFC